MERNLIFKVIRTSDMHEYRVYDDCSVEGFGEGNMLFDYHSPLLSMAIARARLGMEEKQIEQ